MPDPRNKAGAAAIAAIKKCGLCGRPDSPPEWDRALNGATAGDPILVKHPSDERDDFFLVPLNPADPSARLGVWAMLDTKTLELREASLLKDWKAPAFPDPDKDVQLLSESETTLSDGTVKTIQAIRDHPKSQKPRLGSFLCCCPSLLASQRIHRPTSQRPEPPKKSISIKEGNIHHHPRPRHPSPKNYLHPRTLPNQLQQSQQHLLPKKRWPWTIHKRSLIGAVVVGGGVMAFQKATEGPYIKTLEKQVVLYQKEIANLNDEITSLEKQSTLWTKRRSPTLDDENHLSRKTYPLWTKRRSPTSMTKSPPSKNNPPWTKRRSPTLMTKSTSLKKQSALDKKKIADLSNEITPLKKQSVLNKQKIAELKKKISSLDKQSVSDKNKIAVLSNEITPLKNNPSWTNRRLPSLKRKSAPSKT